MKSISLPIFIFHYSEVWNIGHHPTFTILLIPLFNQTAVTSFDASVPRNPLTVLSCQPRYVNYRSYKYAYASKYKISCEFPHSSKAIHNLYSIHFPKLAQLKFRGTGLLQLLVPCTYQELVAPPFPLLLGEWFSITYLICGVFSVLRVLCSVVCPIFCGCFHGDFSKHALDMARGHHWIHNASLIEGS